MLKKIFKDKEIKEIRQTINIINQHNSVISQNNDADFDMIKSGIEIMRSKLLWQRCSQTRRSPTGHSHSTC